MRSAGIAIAIVCCAAIADGAPSTAVKSAPKANVKKTPAKKASKRAPAKKPAWKPDPHFTAPTDVTSSPAYRYGKLTQSECETELAARKIGFKREASTLGVRAPVRLTGPLHGVEFRTNLRPAQRATTPWEIADCRIVLALDDFAEILARHDIVEVRHYSIYRLPPKDWPEGKDAARHNGGLAIDAARFIAKDGSFLDVDQHFHGAIGDATCGDKAAPHPATTEATRLRAILCEAVDRRLFNVVLTPNYNRPHKNHFHLEVTDGVKWFLVH